MNVVSGPGRQTAHEQQHEEEMRRNALHFAVEWARSAGPEHCTRVPPKEMVQAAETFYRFLKGASK